MRPECCRLPAVLACVALLGSAEAMSPNASQILSQMTKEVPASAKLNCILQTVPLSSCSLSDFGCICTNAELQDQIVTCLQAHCTVREQLQTQKFQMTSCGVEVRDIGRGVKATIWASYAVAVFSVVCRLVARMPAFGGEFSWDDYTMIVCLLALTPCCVIAHLMINHGLGRDIWMLSPNDIDNTLFYFFIGMYHYTFLLVFTKVSILFLYLRIFTTRRFLIQCYIITGLVAAFGISCIVSTSLYCDPLSAMWTSWDGEHLGTCINVNALTYTFAGINMALDIIIFILPIPQLIPLQMTWQKKAGVGLMFVVGLFVTLCSIMRLQTLLKWGKSTNPTYDYTPLALWSLVEINVGVICACMPGVAGLLRRVMPIVFNSTKGSSDPYSIGSRAPSSVSAGRFGRVSSPKRAISKTTSISVSFGDPYKNSTRLASKSDEFELIDRELDVVEDTKAQGARPEVQTPGHETRNDQSKCSRKRYL